VDDTVRRLTFGYLIDYVEHTQVTTDIDLDRLEETPPGLLQHGRNVKLTP
jgi:hypothetical protein